MKILLFYLSFLFLFACMNNQKRDSVQSNSIELKVLDSTSQMDFEKQIKYYDLQKAIENKDQVRQLFLDGQGYSKIPNEVFKCENLEQLNLAGNHISTIPSDIRTLRKLKYLAFAHNEITIIPASICELQEISALDFNFNRVKSIPNCIFEMPKLHYLGLSIYEANDTELSKFQVLSKRYGTEILLGNARIVKGLIVVQ